ncbi:hyccin-like isoform X1 [Macrosteles quadrilineatus]|uniref:hyccin-like isoform X1 n=1 Tax=Macrosteles quadrilineatus TaxID=74068 RepID=UPI0023E1E1F8|nr:hyccin-like isoform X1 [Macrosteles quadrilineatus]XP_054274905.1 hyccin-like isoform X1 [Macrosteles quadrilineatus]XP_054274913.1 hyccin-like isoform X1 [Macrosteles quadrilineatus]XP_054274922.1 hyccin-like isoform X1 [Macrosteles quadrilineatus]
MTEQLVREWLADYAALSPAEVHTFAVTVHHNAEIIAAIYNVLEERHKYHSLIDPVCTALFGFYRSREEDLQRFTLLFLPTLVYVYLNAVAHSESKSCRGVEALLVGIYNLEVVNEKGQPREISFRLPSLAQASIYHEPMSLAPASLTEAALRRLEECNTKLVRWGPLPQMDHLLAQNRLVVMTALLYVYNRNLSMLPKTALEYLCKVTSKLVTQGFSKAGKRVSYGTEVPRVLPRIPVSSQMLQQLLHSVYYAMYNDHGYMAVQAIEDIHQRACYQCYTDVLLVTNAIKNSAHFIHSGQPSDAPMGISLAISPATTTTTVSKSMITNASFRTKKLPDDIPIQMAKAEGDSTALGAITEEKEEGVGSKGESTPEIAPRRSLPKMAVNFGKKTKEKLTIKSSSSNPKSKPLVNGSGDLCEEENGDLATELTPLSGENGTEISTPVNLRKSSGSTIELEPTRSMQVSSV